MRTFSRTDSVIMEANAVARGVTVDTLMDHAGRVIAEEAAKHAASPPEGRIGIVCGGGNNGGDGLAAAFYLKSKGFNVDIWLIVHKRDVRTRAARRRLEMISDLPGFHVGHPDVDQLKDLNIVVDAMIGTGGKGELREPFRSAVEAIAGSKVPVLSVDLPTGLGTDTTLHAKWTVALEVMKEGMDKESAGEVTVRSIGFPTEAIEETGPAEYLLFPRPAKTTSKGESGRLVIVGGGPYTGAPALAGISALNAGVDMVFIVAPEPAASVIRTYSPNLIVRSVGKDGMFTTGNSDDLWKVVESLHPDALLVGNGAGYEPGTVHALTSLVEKALPTIPVVLDADGTRMAAVRETRPLFGDKHHKFLITPNRRELYRIVGYDIAVKKAERREQIMKLSRALGASILYKGEADFITDGVDFRENRAHSPAMVVAGAGDVLAGVTASLMARGLTAFGAARLASFWIGHASLSLFERRSYGIKATDLSEELPSALKEGLAWASSYLAGHPSPMTLPGLSAHAEPEVFSEAADTPRGEPEEEQ